MANLRLLLLLCTALHSSMSVGVPRPPTVTINDGSRDFSSAFNVQSLRAFSGVNLTNRHQDVGISTRSKKSDLFRVEPRGNLQATEPVDLEALCASGLCCKNAPRGPAECSSEPNACCIELWLFPPDSNTHETIFVKVVDVNEFAPRFPNAHEDVSVYENQRASVSLPVPVDLDFSQRNLYIFIRASESGLFSDRLPLRLDGTASRLTLNLGKELDREVRDTYKFQVLACERERIDSQCGSVNVTLTVLDVNDNPPRFNVTNKQVNVTVQESQSAETYITTLTALDRDEGENGAVSYFIDGEAKCLVNGAGLSSPCWGVDERLERASFEIRGNGELFAVGPLDYEDCKRFSLQVRASNGAPSTFADTLEVQVNVLDADDTRPCVRWVPSSRARLAENSAPGAELSSVLMVWDLDTALEQVTCELHSAEQFRLKPAAGGDGLRFLVLTNRSFDRENEEIVTVDVRCSDQGPEPSASDWLPLMLEITDVNDNAPQFELDDAPSGKLLLADVDENAPPGTHIRTLLATDMDAYANAELEYSFANRTAYQFFNLDALSGNLSTAVAFDYERTPELRFVVLAVDRGLPRLTASATLLVRVNDENDNSPRFAESRYVLRVSENALANSPVGTVLANDADSKPGMTYRFVEAQEHFIISDKGEIFVYRSLDREALPSDRYVLTVAASDSLHSATATVEIVVEDQNDRRPRFVNPSSINSTVRFTCPHSQQCSVAPGCLVTQVRAHDDDASAAHALSVFSISGASLQDAFEINSVTGELYYRHDPARGCVSVAKVTLEVRDAQKPELADSLVLNVLFLKEERRDSSISQSVPLDGVLQVDTDATEGGFISTHQLMIVLAVSAAFVVCAVVLLLVLLSRIRVRKGAANDDDAEAGAHRHTGCDSAVDGDDTQSHASSQAVSTLACKHDAEKIEDEYCGAASLCSDSITRQIDTRTKAGSPYFSKTQPMVASRSFSRRIILPDTMRGKSSVTPSQPYIYFSIGNNGAVAAERDSPVSHNTNSCIECSMQRQFSAQMKQCGEEEHAYASAAEYDPQCTCPDCMQLRMAMSPCSPTSFPQLHDATLKCASVHVPTNGRYAATVFNPSQQRNVASSLAVAQDAEKHLLVQRSDGYLTTLPRRKPDSNNNADVEKAKNTGMQHSLACPPDCQNPRCVVSYV